jgi:hypothetical protein
MVLAAAFLVSSVTVGRASGVRITVPVSGARVTGQVILVRGEVPPGAGVTVNGLPALVEGDRFVGLVPADPSVTLITATARDFTGMLGTESVRVTVDTPPQEDLPLRLQATPLAGIPPLTVRFKVNYPIALRRFSFDADGDGRSEAQGGSGVPFTGATFTYSRPGIYAASFAGTDLQGAARSALAVVQVFSPTDLDVRLQFVWSSIKTALKSGDVARAVEFLHSDTRDRYRQQFDRMDRTTLANIDQTMTTIRLVEVGFGGAEYEMLRPRDGKTYSYAVWFQLDRDGLWRLRRF